MPVYAVVLLRCCCAVGRLVCGEWVDCSGCAVGELGAQVQLNWDIGHTETTLETMMKLQVQLIAATTHSNCQPCRQPCPTLLLFAACARLTSTPIMYSHAYKRCATSRDTERCVTAEYIHGSHGSDSDFTPSKASLKGQKTCQSSERDGAKRI